MTVGSKHRFGSPFLVLMVGQLISNLGNALAGLAVTWLIIELTNSAMARGLSLALSVLPVLLLSPFSGALVDRYRRRSILATSDFVRFLIDLLFAGLVMLGWVRVGYIYLFTILRSAATIFYDPALSALIQILIPRERLVKANGQQQLMQNVSMVLGPVLASLSLARIGIGAVILVDGVTFLLSALILLYLRVPDDVQLQRQRTPQGQQLREGWVYVRQHSWIILLTSSFMLVNASGAVFGVILPFFARDALGMDLTNYGLLTSASAAGGVAASLLLSAKTLPWKRRTILLWAMFSSAVIVTALILTRSPLPAALVLFLLGATGPFMASTSNSMYQAVIPREYMGRVGVFRRLVSQIMQPVFMLLTGLLSTVFGYTVCLLIAAGVRLISACMVQYYVHVPEHSQPAQSSAAI